MKTTFIQFKGRVTLKLYEAGEREPELMDFQKGEYWEVILLKGKSDRIVDIEFGWGHIAYNVPYNLFEILPGDPEK
jgi:hypothetical protein